MNISLRHDPRYNWWLVLGLLAGLYLLINLALPLLPGAFIATFVVQPILWGLLAWAILVLFPRYRAAAKLRIRSSLIQLGLMIGFFQVAILVIGGLFSGFGNSPYSFTPVGIITNLIFAGSMLIGMEVSRAWLVNRLGKRHTFLAISFVAVLYTLLSIPPGQLADLGPNIESIALVNSTLLPSLAENLLATFLALLAGPLAAIAYRGVMEAFWWFCPILPDLPWLFQGLIGTIVPIMGLAAAQSSYSSQIRPAQGRRAKEGSMAGWIVTTVVAVAIMWFAVGLFPIHPMVVATGSMRPVMDAGDVVIVAKAPADVIEPGDIIQFREEGGISVLHRVVEIYETEGARFFITKGDANDQRDKDPVSPGNVVGKVVFAVPRIGWAAVAIKEFLGG